MDQGNLWVDELFDTTLRAGSAASRLHNPDPILVKHDDLADERRSNVAFVWATARHDLARIVGREMAHGPGLEILLGLFVGRFRKVRTIVKTVCLGTNAPAATVIRWIDKLEARGLVDRLPDPLDGRRLQLALTQHGLDLAREALDTIWQSSRQLNPGS
ncbi:MAG: winged helix DNA-binding protein [Sphingomonas sp.]|uniref:hypothetical protein n=1 Tax=Sphingomonas sp. TaxID=28214 RepID=UPI001AD00878|nr:hypothetical protein [Sphingomonas sp.]MBN8809338.1 winged helix DNA-binding protein [Sphingomonas sp.]